MPSSSAAPPPATSADQAPRVLRRLFGLLAGRRAKFIPLLLGIVASAVMFAVGGTAASSTDPTFGMPAGADSTAAVRLQERLPQSQQQPAIVVYSRPGGTLGAADRQAIDRDRTTLATIAEGGKLAPTRFFNDEAALVAVPLRSVPAGVEGAAADRLNDDVARIRSTVTASLPSGARAQVTGPAAFQADFAKVFDGADGLLLGVTAIVVAVLLLVTYRSPWLWLVPLTVIGLADRVVAALFALLSRTVGLVADGATTGIVSVLVFGAGTNYALLLVARYREELRRHDDRHEAMHAALTHAAPAILASSTTVALSLATLAVADLPFDRNIGIAGAIGIVVAVVFVLGMLPPALLIFGRSLFWPIVPRFGDDDPSRGGVWARLGTAVTARPIPVTVATVALLAVLALGSVGSRSGLSETEKLRDRPDSVLGQETIARTFGAGSGEPAVIIATDAAAGQVRSIVQGTPGVVAASVGSSGDGLTQIDAQLRAAPSTDGAFDTIRSLRSRLADAPGDPKVGGQSASDLDEKTSAARDRLVIVPLVLAVVLLVLLILLRSVVAALLLALSNVVSWAAALGAASWAFEHVFGFAATDLPVPLLSFLFLVALGVDYNIFLITRAREELRTSPTRRSIVAALASTGGVITSAGILLASVFAVLGVLPLVTLTQVGIVVGFGILLDTLVVRTVLVPAMVTLAGDRFWWPGGPRRDLAADAPQP